MEEYAIFITFRAKPGKRDEVRATYERLVKPHVAVGEHLLSYSYCYHLEDEDTICLFERHAHDQILNIVMELPWFQEYMKELEQLLAEPIKLTPLRPIHAG